MFILFCKHLLSQQWCKKKCQSSVYLFIYFDHKSPLYQATGNSSTLLYILPEDKAAEVKVA